MLSVQGDTSSYQKFLSEFVNDSTITKQSLLESKENEHLDQNDFQQLVDRLDEGLTYDIPEEEEVEIMEEDLSHLDNDSNSDGNADLQQDDVDFDECELSKLDNDSDEGNDRLLNKQINHIDSGNNLYFHELDAEQDKVDRYPVDVQNNFFSENNELSSPERISPEPKLNTVSPPFKTPASKLDGYSVSTPFFTPRITDHDMTPTDNRASKYSAASQYAINEVLAEARDECHNLRVLNEKLIVASDDFRQKISYLELENEKIKIDNKRMVDNTRKEILDVEREKRKALEEQISHLQKELSTAQSNHVQISSIRQNLEREKELDLLTMRKEMLSQKEQQLHDLRIEMSAQKDELKRLFHIELEAERRDFETQKAELKAGIEEYSVKIRNYENEIKSLRDQWDNFQNIKSNITNRDFTQQADALHNDKAKVKQLENELNYIKEQILRLFSQSSYDDNSSFCAKSSDEMIDICREFVRSTESTIYQSRIETQNLMTELESKRNKLISDHQEEKTALENQHHENLRGLKMSHRTEIANQKQTYESRIQNLESRHSLTIEQKDLELNMLKEKVMQSSEVVTPKIESLQDLLNAFPVYMANYRSQIEKSLTGNSRDKDVVSKLKQEHLITIRQLEQSFQLQKDKYSARHRSDVESLKVSKESLSNLKIEYESKLNQCELKWKNLLKEVKNEHRDEIFSITKRIKEQCSTAYESALEKIKKEYYKLENELKIKFENESSNIRKNFEKRSSIDEDHYKAKIREYQSQIKSSKVKKVVKFQEQMESLRDCAKRDLEDTKKKYVQTLKKMRDELGVNKKLSWERLETEWLRRKKMIHDEWCNRIEAIKIHCDCHHSGCRCINLLESLINQFPIESTLKPFGKSSLYDVL